VLQAHAIPELAKKNPGDGWPQQSLLDLIDSMRFIPFVLTVRTMDSPLHRPAPKTA
jgi:hypothetical protein